jgi:hypothetical protein
MKKADFYTLFVEIYRLIINEKKQLDKSKCRAFLDEFYKNVDEVSSDKYHGENDEPRVYYKAALQASNDRGNRISRGKIISNILSNC